jgi:hypothetical protein
MNLDPESIKSNQGAPEKAANQTLPSNHQSVYQPVSQGENDNTYTPEAQNKAVRSALLDLKSRVGCLDDFVMKELNYPTLADLHNAFMGFQVDAIALAIDNISKGEALIIADTTGQGKGRQAAGIMRYARLKNITPVFITADAPLFNDIYRDLTGIGENEHIKPFLLNNDSYIAKKVSVTNKTGEIVERNIKIVDHKNTFRTKVSKYIAENGELPKEFNALFLTYSQISSSNETSVKRKLFRAIAPNSIFILDEAHKAAGEREKRHKVKGDTLIKPTGAGHFFNTLEYTQGVVYLSATHAKRADNLPIYYKTALSDAADSIDDLATAAERGGIPLQTIISNLLSQNGQLIRRERSFEGISFKKRDDIENAKKHIELSDKITSCLRAIIEANSRFNARVYPYIEELENKLDIKPTEIEVGLLERLKPEYDFIASSHIFIEQMLLALKADTVIDIAIDTHKRGRKPIITLENTMGSFIATLLEKEVAAPDKEIDLSFKTILLASLEKTRTIRLAGDEGDIHYHLIDYKLMDSITVEEYKKAEQAIENLDVGDLPATPIDYILHKLELNGITMAEITGREYKVEYTKDGKSILKRRTPSDKNKLTNQDLFNHGQRDGLIFNKAGTTGWSGHHSNDSEDKRPRTMISAQLMRDINDQMQAYGRINRAKQLSIPEYIIPLTALPIEVRQMSLQEKKLKQLNAQTSSDEKSNNSIENVPEMMNKYGDRIATSVLEEDMRLSSILKIEIPENGVLQGAMKLLTSRMALLPCETQSKLMQSLIEEYTSYIDMLDSTGQNDLTISILDFEATTVHSTLYAKGKGGSIFGSDIVIHECLVNRLGKPPRYDEVIDEIKSLGSHPIMHNKRILNLAHEDNDYVINLEKRVESKKELLKLARKHMKEHCKRLNIKQDELSTAFNNIINDFDTKALSAYKNFSAAQQHKATAEKSLVDFETSEDSFSRLLQLLQIEKCFEFRLGLDKVKACIVGIKYTHQKGHGNPFALSKIKIKFALNHTCRYVTMSLSQLNIRPSGQLDNSGVLAERIFKPLTKAYFPGISETITRETRFIAVGNLIQGSAELVPLGGRVVQFTTDENQLIGGIVMPKSFSILKLPERPLPFRTTEHLMSFMSSSFTQSIAQGSGVGTRDFKIILLKNADNSFSLRAPLKNNHKTSNRVKMDAELRTILNQKPELTSTAQVFKIPKEDLEAVVTRIMKITGIYIGAEHKNVYNLTLSQVSQKEEVA